MAAYQAIAATSQAILAMLANACPAAFPNFEFKLYQSNTFTNRGVSPTVSLYLYNVVPSTVRRSLPPQRKRNGAVMCNPLSIDLHYLVTAWASDAVQQQRLLGWAMQVMHDNPLIPATALNAAGPEPEIFEEGESVEIHLQSLPLGDLDILWKVNDNKPQPSAAYAVRMLLIDSAEPLTEAPDVQTRDLRFGHLVTS